MSGRLEIKIFIGCSMQMEAERKESVSLITELNKRYSSEFAKNFLSKAFIDKKEPQTILSRSYT